MSWKNVMCRMRVPDRRLWLQFAGVLAVAILLTALPAVAGQNEQGQPPETYQPFEPGEGSQALPSAGQQAPPALTLRPGTLITVRVSQFLSSDQNRPGDRFDAVLEQPVVVDGWVVVRKGQTVLGRVAIAQKAGRGERESRLGVELGELILVDGQQLPIRTRLMQTSMRTSRGPDVAAVGITTATGAAIGGAVGRGEGAGIGAVAGAAAGIIGVLLTPGRPTVIPPETILTFQLESPLTVSTERRAQAFQPVNSQDYQDYDYYRDRLRYRQNPSAAPPPAYPPPAPYYGNYYYGGYPYGYPAWGYYPGPYWGFYGGFGPTFVFRSGPRFGGFGRGGFRGGFRR